MPQFEICAKCKLSLPRPYLTPVVLSNGRGQSKKGYLCNHCKSEIDAQQKGQGNGTN